MEFHDARELGRQFKVDHVTVRRWAQLGIMPPPDRIGGTIRWPASRIEAWVRAGCRPMLSTQSCEGK